MAYFQYVSQMRYDPLHIAKVPMTYYVLQTSHDILCVAKLAMEILCIAKIALTFYGSQKSLWRSVCQECC